MARITVEDCLKQIPNRYEMVKLAAKRVKQLAVDGREPTVDPEDDKPTVIALREIAEEKIKVKDLSEAAVYKLRKHIEQVDDGVDDDEEVGDDFETLYKGEISKSGAPILPSKRARKTPEKIQVSQDDLAELSQTAQPDVDTSVSEDNETEQNDVSLEEVSESEEQVVETNPEDTETSNS